MITSADGSSDLLSGDDEGNGGMPKERRGRLASCERWSDPSPAGFEELLEERRRLDQDRRDEVWEGVLHVIPPPSHAHEELVITLGYLLRPYAKAKGMSLTGGVAIGTSKNNYRVPDLAMHGPGAARQWHPTAALVVEIRSRGDSRH